MDSVIVTNVPDECKELAVLSHISGGLALYPTDINQGMSFFEQSAFLDVDERPKPTTPVVSSDRKTIPRLLKPSTITRDLVDKGMKCVTFDIEIPNKNRRRIQSNNKLSSPRYICFMNKDKRDTNPRLRRILRELHYAAMVMDNTLEDQYDPDLIVYPFSTNFDIWQVYR